jgi:hypothetical protein
MTSRDSHEESHGHGKTGHDSTPAGELIDKITILEIKAERFEDAARLTHVRRKLAMLSAADERTMACSAELLELARQVKANNEELRQSEDAIRVCERKKDFEESVASLPGIVIDTLSFFSYFPGPTRTKEGSNVGTGRIPSGSYRGNHSC